MSQKKSLHFAWIIVPYVCVFDPCSFVSCSFQGRWSVCSTHFNGLMLTRRGYEGCCDIHTSLIWFFSTASVFFLIYFCILLLLLKSTITYGLVFCICGIDRTVLASGWPTENVFCTPETLTASCATNPPLWHPSTRCKAQSLLPFIEVSSWQLSLFCFFSFHFTISRWSDHVTRILWCYYRVIEPNRLLKA